MRMILTMLVVLLGLTTICPAMGIDGFVIGSNFSSYPDVNNSFLPGFSVGLLGVQHLSDQAFVSVEFYYHYKRGGLRNLNIADYKSIQPTQVNVYNIDYNLHQLEIPVMLKFRLYENNQVKLYAGAGTGYSYSLAKNALLNAFLWYEKKQPDGYTRNYQADPYKKNENGVIWTAAIGAELSYLIIECRYQRAGYTLELTDALVLENKPSSLYLTLLLKIL